MDALFQCVPYCLAYLSEVGGRTSARCHIGSVSMKGWVKIAGVAAFGAACLWQPGASMAQQIVKIGAVYPFSGNAASAGNYSKAAIELGVEIVNNPHPELKDIPLAATVGLPGLGGAKIEVVFADNQGTPAAGQNQTL
ncbi:MAG: ABC transporter substrate-binding protein, partial [Steroidobacteraceae bacterium]